MHDKNQSLPAQQQKQIPPVLFSHDGVQVGVQRGIQRVEEYQQDLGICHPYNSKKTLAIIASIIYALARFMVLGLILEIVQAQQAIQGLADLHNDGL